MEAGLMPLKVLSELTQCKLKQPHIYVEIYYSRKKKKKRTKK